MASNLLEKVTNTNILILLQTADQLGIKWQVLDWDKYKIKLSQDQQNHLITKKSFGLNHSKAIEISRDKYLTNQQLKQADLNVLRQLKINSLAEYFKKADSIPFPQVIKPVTGEKGWQVYIKLADKNQAVTALNQLFKYSQSALIEPYFDGQDHRFLILNNQLIGLAQRYPPIIKPDGQNSLRTLIENENQRRLKLTQTAGKRMLNRLLVWPRIQWYLNQQGLNLDSVPEKERQITIYPLANFSTGGSVKTIAFDQIHPGYITIAQQAAQSLDLTIAGVDMLIKDNQIKPSKTNYVINEVNSDPSLRLHEWPNQGKPQLVTQKILKFIFD